MKKYLKTWLIVIGIVFFVLILALIGAIFVFEKIYQGKIYPGVNLGQFNLENKTKEEALNLIKEKIAEIDRRGLVFRVREKEIVIMPVLLSPTDPDIIQEILIFDPEKTVENAFSLGRQGNFWQKISTQRKLLFDKTSSPASLLYLSYHLNEEELQKILKENFQEIERPAQDAQLVFTMSDTGHTVGFKVESETYGHSLDYQTATEELKENLNLLIFETIDLNLIIDEPKIKKSQTGLVLEEAYEILNLAPLILKYKDKKWEVNKSELGKWLKFSLQGISPLKKSEELSDQLKEPPAHVQIDQSEIISITLAPEKINKFLENIGPEINIPVKEGKFQMKDSRVIEFQTSQEGLELDNEKSTQDIIKEVIKRREEQKNKKTEEPFPLSPHIELIVKKIKPLISTEEVNIFGIKELIGQGESDFKGSPKNRRHNIKVGADQLNGLLIRPAEEFSLVKALGKTDAKAGYLPELVIKGNKTIPEYGGGLCQIGTTTFRVALNAGLPILERQPHSYRVSYYEPAGMDATIYNPRPDFRFLNDTGEWILFQTKISGDKLIFEFYGTNDGRKTEVSQPKIFNIIKPGPTKIIETEDLSPGEKKCTERAHDGADAEFYRTISYSNGEIEREIWKSHYKPWPAVCLIGIKPKPVEAESIEIP